MTRTALLGRVACFALMALAAAPVFADEPHKPKVLFVGANPDHPYGSHMYLHVCGVLAKCVTLTPNVETVVSNGWPKEAKMLDGVNTIVVYSSPAAEMLLDGPHRDEFAGMMNRGVGLVTIHWASSVYQKNLERLGPTWTGYLGGTWVSNVGLGGGKSNLRQLLPEHPVYRGWQEYEISDEYYLNPTVKPGQPLLQVKNKGKDGEQDVVVGWVHERKDGGRAFGTTLGHPYENFRREPFRRMLVNAILWTAHVEVPQTGAPVSLAEEDLALPPKP